MRTEKEKMIAGELYDPLDEEITADRLQARLLIKQFNDTGDERLEERTAILKKLIPVTGKNLWLQPPFYCDYGYNIIMGDNVYLNFNCILLDVSYINIGSRTMLGPNVQIYTATHPINYKERSAGKEYSKAINIGEDVWIGGSAVICPGVSIGDRSIIGAGSVVTKNIPADVVAAGNPCKIIRKLNATDH